MTLETLLKDKPDVLAAVQEEINKVNSAEPDKLKHVRFADLSEGEYVARSKHDDKIGGLTRQVSELQAQIKKRDDDMTALQTQLAAAQTDAGKLPEVQAALSSLQEQYSTDQKTWEQKNAQQLYDFMIREKAGEIKFSSAAAKRDFISQAKSKEFKIDGDVLLGFEDFFTKYKSENPGALVEEKPQEQDDSSSEKQPKIVLPQGTQPNPGEKSVFGFHFNGVRPKPSNE